MDIKITEQKDDHSGLVISRTATITPNDFPRGQVTVSMRERYDPEKLAIIPVVDISWDSGRRDGRFDGLELVHQFICALDKAIDIAIVWQCEFGGRRR